MYLVFIDHIERLHFFNRVQFYSEKIVFVTARLSVYLLAKYKYKHKFVYYIKNKHSIHGVFDEQINNSRDYKAGYVSYNDANILAGSVLSALKELTSSEDVKGILMWNGTDVAERVIGNFSRENNIELYYFEISNLPGKLFIDSMGTNADSVLFHSKDLNWMSQIPKKNNLEYVDFLDVYKKIKSGEYILPQSKKIKSLNYYFLIDYVGSFFSITPRTQSLSIFKKISSIKKRFTLSARKKTLGEKIEIFNDYAFLPLQVSSDSQLLLNSDVDNISAIKISMDYCNEKKLELLIKIHPAESDGKKIEEYTLMSKVYGFRLVTNNTFELIKNAKIVITINSTVGLESKMFNIDTLFLGRSFYDKLNGDLLEDYIQRYLFDADYFGENIIDFNLIKKHYNHIKKISKG